MTTGLLDTHFYDTKIRPYAQKIISNQDTNRNEFMYCIDGMRRKLDMASNTRDIRTYVIQTLNLLEQNYGQNVDSSDNLNSSFLLIKIFDKIYKEPANDLYYIFEQLADVSSSGPCLQGRSKRLFQIYKCLYD